MLAKRACSTVFAFSPSSLCFLLAAEVVAFSRKMAMIMLKMPTATNMVTQT